MITHPSTSGDYGPVAHGAVWANRIREQAECRLRRNASLSMETVRCDYHEGVLRLSGHVPSYYLKQLAQETVLGVSGVETVENEVEVLPARRARK